MVISDQLCEMLELVCRSAVQAKKYLPLRRVHVWSAGTTSPLIKAHANQLPLPTLWSASGRESGSCMKRSAITLQTLRYVIYVMLNILGGFI